MNAKMNLLALALLGLAGYAGSAVAGCPGSPVPPWTAANQFDGTLAIVAGGLDGSACRLNSQISAGASGFATAQVEDDTPAAEPRYRAQFMINVDGLDPTTVPAFTGVVTVHSAISATTGNGITLSLFSDGSQWLLSYTVVDAGDPSGYFSNSTPLGTGSKHVEYDLPVSASSAFKLWVEGNDENTPTLTHTTNNAAIAGIDTAFLGLAAPSDAFTATFAGTAAQFDRFDSRRQTFIGF